MVKADVWYGMFIWLAQLGVAYRKCTARMNINNAQHMDALAAAHMHATTQQLLGNAAAGRGLRRSGQQTKSKGGSGGGYATRVVAAAALSTA